MYTSDVVASMAPQNADFSSILLPGILPSGICSMPMPASSYEAWPVKLGLEKQRLCGLGFEVRYLSVLEL